MERQDLDAKFDALIPANALLIVKQLEFRGHRAWLVGGCVRDMMLNVLPKDFDIATDATPSQIAQLLPKSHTYGKNFQIVTHHISPSERYEISTLRSDDGYGTHLEDDWRHRDFTINALYYDPRLRVIISMPSSFSHLNARQLRFIPPTTATINKDPLRLLRGVRLAAKLDLEVDPDTLSAIANSKERLSEVVPARVYDEVVLALSTGKSSKLNELLSATGLRSYLFPVTSVDRYLGGTWERWFGMVLESRSNSSLNLAAPRDHATWTIAGLLWPVVHERADHSGSRSTWLNALSGEDSYVKELLASARVPKKVRASIVDIWKQTDTPKSPPNPNTTRAKHLQRLYIFFESEN